MKNTEKQDSPENSSSSGKKSLVKKNRCHVCHKNLGILGIQCRCGFMFCNLHRFSEAHQCTFDFKNHDKTLLKEKLQSEICRISKLDKI